LKFGSVGVAARVGRGLTRKVKMINSSALGLIFSKFEQKE